MVGVFLYEPDLFLRHLPDDFGRPSHDKAAVRYDRSPYDKGSRADQTMTADHRTVHDNRTHADQCAVSHSTAMHDRAVSDRHVIADHDRKSPAGMNDCIILHISALSDPDPALVAAQNRIVPHTALPAQGNFPDNPASLCPKNTFMNSKFIHFSVSPFSAYRRLFLPHRLFPAQAFLLHTFLLHRLFCCTRFCCTGFFLHRLFPAQVFLNRHFCCTSLYALKTYLSSLSIASCTRLSGRARLTRRFQGPLNIAPSCSETPTRQHICSSSFNVLS